MGEYEKERRDEVNKLANSNFAKQQKADRADTQNRANKSDKADDKPKGKGK